MEKELAFKTPSIVTYVYEGYMLGIMQANGDKYKEWMLSNYIQLNCHDNFVKEGELFLAFYDDIAIKSPFLKTKCISNVVQATTCPSPDATAAPINPHEKTLTKK